MVNEDAALLNRPVTHMTPAALFSRRLQSKTKKVNISKYSPSTAPFWQPSHFVV